MYFQPRLCYDPLMRRNRQQITSQNEIEEIIAGAAVARLGINRDGAPYIVPMNFGYHKGTFYFHCAGEGLKLDLLEKDPSVCIEIDIPGSLISDDAEKPCSWGFGYRSVIATGRAVFLSGLSEKLPALEHIVRHYGGREFAFRRCSFSR